MDAAIAFFAYCCAQSALKGKIWFLLYVAFILGMGALWAKSTLREYPESKDKKELRFIQYLQTVWVMLAVLFVILWYRVYGVEVKGWLPIAAFITLGWDSVLLYELFVWREETGIMHGPGVPFFPGEPLNKLKEKVKKWRRK